MAKIPWGTVAVLGLVGGAVLILRRRPSGPVSPDAPQVRTTTTTRPGSSPMGTKMPDAPFMEWEIDEIKDSRLGYGPTVERTIETAPGAIKITADLRVRAWLGGESFQEPAYRLVYSRDLAGGPVDEVETIFPMVATIVNTPEIASSFNRSSPPFMKVTQASDVTLVHIILPPGDGGMYMLEGPLRIYWSP